jgi:hypothetical protein
LTDTDWTQCLVDTTADVLQNNSGLINKFFQMHHENASRKNGFIPKDEEPMLM